MSFERYIDYAGAQGDFSGAEGLRLFQKEWGDVDLPFASGQTAGLSSHEYTERVNNLLIKARRPLVELFAQIWQAGLPIVHTGNQAEIIQQEAVIMAYYGTSASPEDIVGAFYEEAVLLTQDPLTTIHNNTRRYLKDTITEADPAVRAEIMQHPSRTIYLNRHGEVASRPLLLYTLYDIREEERMQVELAYQEFISEAPPLYVQEAAHIVDIPGNVLVTGPVGMGKSTDLTNQIYKQSGERGYALPVKRSQLRLYDAVSDEFIITDIFGNVDPSAPKILIVDKLLNTDLTLPRSRGKALDLLQRLAARNVKIIGMIDHPADDDAATVVKAVRRLQGEVDEVFFQHMAIQPRNLDEETVRRGLEGIGLSEEVIEFLSNAGGGLIHNSQAYENIFRHCMANIKAIGTVPELIKKFRDRYGQDGLSLALHVPFDQVRAFYEDILAPLSGASISTKHTTIGNRSLFNVAISGNKYV